MTRQPTPVRMAVEHVLFALMICSMVGLVLVGNSSSHAQTSKRKKQTINVDAIPFKPNLDTYIVEQGDNLWNITRKVTGSAWLWPRVWAYNPEITNPNWIYPGDQIRFFPSDVELPSLYDLASAQREMPQEPQPAKIVEEENTRPAPRGIDPARFVGLFVTPKELSEAGTLRNSADEHILLSPDDRVFLSFPRESQPRSGERYFVYRTVGKVTHPVTKKNFGYMTEVTGFASIEEVYEKVSKARIDATRLEVERGQFVTKVEENLKERVTPTAASSALEGYVLAVNYDTGVVAGTHNVVFIDKGKNDGVQRGNQFTVTRSDDPIVGDPKDLPPKPIATLMVVDTRDNASTCLVVASKQEVEPGLKVKAVTR
ncbi:MAG: LysM peptidoglycan-binding domain-containing protein [Myxococcota bacterium]